MRILGAIFLVLLPTVIALLRGLPAGGDCLNSLQFEPGIYGVILVLVVLLEPLGPNGLWRKIKFFFWQFPMYKSAPSSARRLICGRSACSDHPPGERDLATGGLAASRRSTAHI